MAKKSVVVAQPKTKAVATWRERAAASVAASKAVTAKLPQQSGNFLSLRGGTITLGGAKMPNPLALVILATSYVRAYYSKPWSPNAKENPDCYSYDGVAPHEKSAVPQSKTCEVCAWNRWGSTSTGKGKGCKEGARFAAISADTLESPEQVLNGKMVQARLSVMNAMGFRDYTGYFEANDMPIWGRQTTMHVEASEATQYATKFEASLLPKDDGVMNAIAARVDEAERLLAQPYIEYTEAAPAAPARTAKRKF